jgi:hypothetical protein
MKLLLCPEVFFPGSTVTTRFGWDTDPPGPRIHHAIDRAGSGIVHSPIAASSSAWIDNDAQACSVIRLIIDGGELRLLHFIRSELVEDTLQDLLKGASIEAGQPLGPTGNHGLSIPSKGGTGRHVHYSLVLKPGAYDKDLADHFGPGWKNDWSADYRAKYGRAYIEEAAKRGVRWANDSIIAKADPYADGRLRFYVNTTTLGL